MRKITFFRLILLVCLCACIDAEQTAGPKTYTCQLDYKTIKLFNGKIIETPDGYLLLIGNEVLTIIAQYNKDNNLQYLGIRNKDKKITKTFNSTFKFNFHKEILPGETWPLDDRYGMRIHAFENGGGRVEFLDINLSVLLADNKVTIFGTQESSFTKGGLCSLSDATSEAVKNVIDKNHDLFFPMCQSKLQEAEKMCNAVLKHEAVKDECTFKQNTAKNCIDYVCFLMEQKKMVYEAEIRSRIAQKIGQDCMYNCSDNEPPPLVLSRFYNISLPVHPCVKLTTEAPSTSIPSTTKDTTSPSTPLSLDNGTVPDDNTIIYIVVAIVFVLIFSVSIWRWRCKQRRRYELPTIGHQGSRDAAGIATYRKIDYS